jgi:hypothetical protein
MSISELETKLSCILPKYYREFLVEHPNGYVPDQSVFIDSTHDIAIVQFYGINELLEGWYNTNELPEIKENGILLVAETLGNSEVALGISHKNADTIFYLDWHSGLSKVKENIDDFLLALIRDSSSL